MTSNVSPLPTLQQQRQQKLSSLFTTSFKRRSYSTSSESSSYSLPFKKRRFVRIPTSSDDEEDRLISSPFALSPINVAASKQEPQQQQDKRELLVATPTQGILGPGTVSSSSSMAGGIACITPVPNPVHDKKKRKTVAVPKQVSHALRAFHSMPENNEKKNPSRDASLVPGPMQTRLSRRNSSTDATTTTSSSSSVLCDSKPSENECPSANDDGGATNRHGTAKLPKQRAPRDKLYRGSDTTTLDENGKALVEVRCLAISTRGKRCCYAAVAANGNEYCHRHGSFFVGSDRKQPNTSPSTNATANPTTPKNKSLLPKAISTTTSTSTSSNKELSKSNCVASSRRRKRSLAIPPKVLLTAIASDGSSSSTQPRPPSALSDLSTDLWKNQRVLISKGPHESKIGTVVRWRNGWVTVELPSPLSERQNKSSKTEIYHNRRSYELFLAS